MPKIILNEEDILKAIDAVHNVGDDRTATLGYTRAGGGVFTCVIEDKPAGETPAADAAIPKTEAT